MRTRSFTIVFGAGFLGAAIALGGWPQPSESNPTRSPTTAVRVDRVEAGRAARTVRFSGVTRAARRAALSFAVPARVASRPVEVGDRVEAGTVLAALDDREFRHAADSAAAVAVELEVRLAQAERDRRRIERLVAARAATTEELEQLTAAASATAAASRAAAARSEEARRLLAETTLRAPFSGTVTAVRLEPGEWANPGQPVVELSGADELEVELEVPESVVGGLAADARVAVHLPLAGGATIAGRIVSISHAATGPGRLFPVLVALEAAPYLAAGMTAELDLQVAGEESLTVPLRAVLDPGSSRPSVLCVRAGVARQVPVQLGPVVADRIAVEGDLSANEVVVVSGHTLLADGDPVEVRS